jgi:AraC-like DNA-binding protein
LQLAWGAGHWRSLKPDHVPRYPATCRVIRASMLLEALMDEAVRMPVHYDEDGRDGQLVDWADRSGLSRRTLTRLFRRETGQSFSAWRQRVRLLEALARLGAGESVTSVALDVGYDSPSAFTAMFRRELGAAPRRYLRWADQEIVLR